jgi:hypothetical protein
MVRVSVALLLMVALPSAGSAQALIVGAVTQIENGDTNAEAK